MNENSRLYWTALSKYEGCPQNFLWSYGWGDIDLGNGPGKSRTIPVRRSSHHALMGIVIQAVLEKLYNEELYREPKSLTQTLLALVEREWLRHSRNPRNWVDFREAGMSEEEMIQTCRDGVGGYLRTMKAHKLIGPYAKSEVDLIGWVDKWLCVGGRADFIIRREDSGITILDGKNTKRKLEGVDPDQLRWYAMVFRLAYKQPVDRIGFVWFRYPHGMAYAVDPETGSQTVEEGVEWIPFTEDDLRGLALRAQEARKGMRKEKFEAKPNPKGCEYCDFVTVCEARIAQRAANSEKRTSKEKEVLQIPQAGGFIDFSVEG